MAADWRQNIFAGMFPGVGLAKCVKKRTAVVYLVNLETDRSFPDFFRFISHVHLKSDEKMSGKGADSTGRVSKQTLWSSFSSWAVRFIIDSLTRAACCNFEGDVAAFSCHCVLLWLTDLLLKPSLVKMNHVSQLEKPLSNQKVVSRHWWSCRYCSNYAFHAFLFVFNKLLFTDSKRIVFFPKLFICSVSNFLPVLLFAGKLDWLLISWQFKPDVKRLYWRLATWMSEFKCNHSNCFASMLSAV